MTFQASVNNQPAPGVEGSRASANPLATFVTGPGGLVSGAAGVTVGRFGWASDGLTVTNLAAAADGLARTPQGIVANLQQGLNTVFLAQSGLSILAGQAMQLFTRGDFWLKMKTTATVPMKAFANLFTGECYPAAAGSTISASSLTASFATNVMTVTVASAAVLTTGMAISGAGVPANTYIKDMLGTGTGGTGTYNLTTSPGTVGSAAGITASSYIETSFRILSAAATSELAKVGYGD